MTLRQRRGGTMANPAIATVYVVDDEPEVRNSLCFLLESSGFTALAFPGGSAFLASVPPTAAGCLVLDLRMPELDGQQVQQALNAAGYTLPVILLTGHGEVPVAVEVMKQGAFDFIQKPANSEQLLGRIAAALRLDATQRETASQRQMLAERYASLTEREVAVMHLVCQGLNNREMADRINISPKTVEVHRGRVMHKMQADSVAELVQQAMLLGLFTT